jgi:hypothetical protein
MAALHANYSGHTVAAFDAAVVGGCADALKDDVVKRCLRSLEGEALLAAAAIRCLAALGSAEDILFSVVERIMEGNSDLRNTTAAMRYARVKERRRSLTC